MSSRTWTNRSPWLAAVVAALATPLDAQVETIGPWQIRAAPSSAALISGGGPLWDWMNVANSQVGVPAAFSGVSTIADGYANAETGTVVEVAFHAGELVNGIGPDLVMLDALYSNNTYDVSTSHDGFQSWVGVPAFGQTGVFRSYYVGGYGPYPIEIGGAGVDLTSLGVPSGATVIAVRFRTTSWECDPVGVGALCHTFACGPIVYCTAGTSQNGCSPTMDSTGTPSASLATPFEVKTYNLEGQRAAMYLYGTTGPLAQPWGTGSSFLCVKAPNQRTGPDNTGGTAGLCNGFLRLDWNPYQLLHSGALGQPWAAGDMVWIQAWYRDPPAAKTSNLSDGLQFVLGP